MTAIDQATLLDRARPASDVIDRDMRSTGVATHRLRRVLIHLVHTLWPVAFLLVAWDTWVTVKHLPPAVAPHPGTVLRYVRANPGTFAGDALDTCVIVLGGLLVGAVGGIALATVSWFSSIARAAISGPALVTQCLPVATMVPVLARIFGYNQRTVVIIAALIAFFPVLVFTTAGLRASPPGTDDLFVVLGAGRIQRFRHLAVPSAIPRLLVSLRLSIVAAVVGAMLAQWIMGTSGLGYRLVTAQASFRTAEAWGASLVAIVLSVLLYSAMAALCRLADRRFG
ncbi:MAG: transporter related protein [Acidimicrobiales bacterium]|nr:transporter related protein [Acidimicrobiales bacterium]